MTVTHDVINPATEELVRTVGLASVEETDEAIARAVAAGPAWRAVAPGDRGRLLRRLPPSSADAACGGVCGGVCGGIWSFCGCCDSAMISPPP